jgi:Zn-dependent M28 family amino/carboxypeptidase
MGRPLKQLLCCSLALCGLLSAQTGGDLTSRYRETSKRIIDAALGDEHGLERLSYLCDRIGNRLSGSPALERAIAWSAAEMKRAGFENVRTIPVTVPHWVRGTESATLLTPVERPLIILGLGNSVGTTKPEGVTGEVVSVSSFEELAKLGRAGVAGKVVLFDVPFTTYGRTVVFRASGPSRAGELGAVAALVRSVTGHSVHSPHTGMTVYSGSGPKIPAAAVTVEDAMALTRLVKSGEKVTVNLHMQAHMERDAASADVMGEITGSEKPQEIVVLGGHIDSWDVGQGAQDDGSGMFASFEALAILKKLGLRPRRTIRVVFWTNEENGGAGGRAYRDWAGSALFNHVAAIEMDGGTEKLVGFDLAIAGTGKTVPPSASNTANQIGRLLEVIGGSAMIPGFGGSDIEPLIEVGVPGFGLRTTGEHYFDWHHTQADTFDKTPQRWRF